MPPQGHSGWTPSGPGGEVVSFVMSRPSHALFPLDEFRASCAAVLARPDLAAILQLGSPAGFEPLRRYLMEEARRQHLAGPGDDLIVTNGLPAGARPHRPRDAAARRHGGGGRSRLPRPEESAGWNWRPACGHPGGRGWDRHRAVGARVGTRAAALPGGHLELPEPTGATLPLAARRELLEAARAARVPVVENDAYGDLRYQGEPLPAIKQLDENGGTVLLRSFSKVSFPGLRVGWVVGRSPHRPPAPSQGGRRPAYRPAFPRRCCWNSPNPDAWSPPRARARAGAERLAATLDACRRYLPANARWTRPRAG